jgi:hypothetical protein
MATKKLFDGSADEDVALGNMGYSKNSNDRSVC